MYKLDTVNINGWLNKIAITYKTTLRHVRVTIVAVEKQ